MDLRFPAAGMVFLALVGSAASAAADTEGPSPCCDKRKDAAVKGKPPEERFRCREASSRTEFVTRQGASGCYETDARNCVGGSASSMCVCVEGVCVGNRPEGSSRGLPWFLTEEECTATAVRGCCSGPVTNCTNQ
jgi:hypothetical protein